MKNLSVASLILILMLLGSVSRAAVIERDWLAPGDGLLTFDDVNNREWLDLSETLLVQFPGADSGAGKLEDLEVRFQSVVTETEVGGRFEGFTVAIGDDIVALAESSGIDTSTFELETNSVAAEILSTFDTWMTPFVNSSRLACLVATMGKWTGIDRPPARSPSC